MSARDVARRAARQQAARQNQQVLLDPFGSFLAWVERERAAKTAHSYGQVLGYFRAAFPDPCGVSAERIEAWTARPRGSNGRQASVNTRRSETVCLKSLYSYLEREGAVTADGNPMHRVTMPSRPKQIPDKGVPREVLNRVVKEEVKPNRLLVLLLLADAGLRANEACSIHADALRSTGSRFYLQLVGKGSKERIVPASGRLAAVWREQARTVEPNSPICRSTIGGLLTDNRIWEYAVDAGLNAGVPDLNPHRWRHSWAHWLYFDKGVPLVKVSRLLGHSSIQTTMTYLGVADHDLISVGDVFDD